MRRWLQRSSPGFTFIELVVATAVMMVLASAALPIARNRVTAGYGVDGRKVVQSRSRGAHLVVEACGKRPAKALQTTRDHLYLFPLTLETSRDSACKPFCSCVDVLSVGREQEHRVLENGPFGHALDLRAGPLD